MPLLEVVKPGLTLCFHRVVRAGRFPTVDLHCDLSMNLQLFSQTHYVIVLCVFSSGACPPVRPLARPSVRQTGTNEICRAALEDACVPLHLTDPYFPFFIQHNCYDVHFTMSESLQKRLRFSQ